MATFDQILSIFWPGYSGTTTQLVSNDVTTGRITSWNEEASGMKQPSDEEVWALEDSANLALSNSRLLEQRRDEFIENDNFNLLMETILLVLSELKTSLSAETNQKITEVLNKLGR